MNSQIKNDRLQLVGLIIDQAQGKPVDAQIKQIKNKIINNLKKENHVHTT